MNEVNNNRVVKLICRRIAKLESVDKVLGVYRLVSVGFSGYGDEEWKLGEFYERVIAGYHHSLVQIESQEAYSLALLPPEGSSAPAYVEIDEWANPIHVKSEKGLEAVKLTEELIQNRAEKGERLLRQIVDAAANEDIGLRMAIFKRIHEHFLEEGAKGDTPILPSLVFELLPWKEVMLPYLEWTGLMARQLAKKELDHAAIADLLATHLPPLGFDFNYLEGDVGYELSLLVKNLRTFADQRLSSQEGVRPDVECIFNFVRAVSQTKADHFHPKIRGKIVRVLDALKGLLEKAGESEELEPEHLSQKYFAIAQASLLIQAFKELTGKAFADLRSLVRNPTAAALAIDEGGLFEDKSTYARRLLQTLVEELENAVGQIPPNPDDLLEDISFKQQSVKSKFNGLLNAGDACRLYAQILFQAGFRVSLLTLASLTEVLGKSEMYYSRAQEFMTSVNEKIMLCLRYSRYFTIKGRILAETTKLDDAREAFAHAMEQTRMLRPEDFPDALSGFYSIGIRRLEALIAEAEKVELTEQTAKEIMNGCEELISRKPGDHKSYELLLQYYLMRKDAASAIEILDRQRNAWLQQRKPKRALEWLQYRAAFVCSEATAVAPGFAIEAVSRYAEVLKDQESNFKAAFELIELFDRLPREEWELSLKTMERNLKKLEEVSCPLTHAIVRTLLSTDLLSSPTHVDSASDALLVILMGPDELLDEAQDFLGSIRPDQLLTIVENMSKWFFRRGRSRPLGWDLRAAERLIDFYLSYSRVRGGLLDRVLLTRKLDIALERKDFPAANQVYSTLERAFPDDPIVSLKGAILLRLQNKWQPAKNILEREAGGRVLLHPGIVNELAIHAVHEANFDHAEKLYKQIINENAIDPTARFGLGRVYFEWDDKYWPKAIAEWLVALRIRSGATAYRDALLARFTARSIAILCRERQRRSAAGEQMLHALEQAILSESPVVSSMIVDALGNLGIVDEELVMRVRNISKDIVDIGFVRRIAQYLMARTIYVILGSEEATDKDGEIATCLQWCHGHNVLPEYLAGAKGSYTRAVLRSLSTDGDKALRGLEEDEIREFKKTLDASYVDYARLYEHVCRSGEYLRDYYRQAYLLSKNLEYNHIRNQPWLVDGLVKGVAYNILEKERYTKERLKSLLRDVSPCVGLWPLKNVLGAQDGIAHVGGWLDRDALSVMQKEFEGNGWRLVDSIVRRPVTKLPSEGDSVLYSKFGLFFEIGAGAGSGQTFYCYIDTVDIPGLKDDVSTDMESSSELSLVQET